MPGPMPDPQRGHLLVATPELGDPNFEGTVVLLLEHGPEGTVGVVLNRPSDLPVHEAMGDGPGDGATRWDDLVPDIGVMHVGGPVQPNAIVALARVPDVADHARWQPVTRDVGVISLGDGGSLATVGHIRQLRIFAGYSGWSDGQLADEIAAGTWFVVPSEPADAFAEEPAQLWRTVLRRQGGLFTTVTPNPAHN